MPNTIKYLAFDGCYGLSFFEYLTDNQELIMWYAIIHFLAIVRKNFLTPF